MYNKHQISILISSFFVALCCGGRTFENNKKLKIDVYFESLCPDSINFIKNQLHRHWKDISPYVDLKLVPFGKSKSVEWENQTKFVCQHGPSECKGNKIMSCALNRIPDQNVQVEYVGCFMDTFRSGSWNKNEFGQECSAKLGFDSKELLETCYHTNEGTILQLEAEKSTKQIQLRFVPTIVYNGVFDQQLQDASLKNFRDVVCSLVKQNYPDACEYRSVIYI